jgi:hypothetical protein
MIAIGSGLLLLFIGLGFVGYHKTRAVASWWSSIGRQLDRSARRVGVLSLVPMVLVATRLILRGVEPVPALMVGAVTGLGVWCVALGLLRMEGLMLETESDATLRQARGEGPPSTPMGRVVSIGVGVAALGLAAYALSIASR